MDFMYKIKDPVKHRKVYDEILSLEWVANYRKNPPVSSAQELGKIHLVRDSKNKYAVKYFHDSAEVVYFVQSIMYGKFYPGGMSDDLYNKFNVGSNQKQKIFDYLSLEKILELISTLANSRLTGNHTSSFVDEKRIVESDVWHMWYDDEVDWSNQVCVQDDDEDDWLDYAIDEKGFDEDRAYRIWNEFSGCGRKKEDTIRVRPEGPDPDEPSEFELERLEDDKQRRWEDDADAFDPYDGVDPPDPVDVDNDPLGHMPDAEFDIDEPPDVEGEEIEQELMEMRVNLIWGYKKILSSEWVANYRKNPPASSFQELGDFSSYDEFEIKINSLIDDLFNKNDFQPEPYQKLFDYLPLTNVLTLVENHVFSKC